MSGSGALFALFEGWHAVGTLGSSCSRAYIMQSYSRIAARCNAGADCSMGTPTPQLGPPG